MATDLELGNLTLQHWWRGAIAKRVNRLKGEMMMNLAFLA